MAECQHKLTKPGIDSVPLVTISHQAQISPNVRHCLKLMIKLLNAYLLLTLFLNQAPQAFTVFDEQ